MDNMGEMERRVLGEFTRVLGEDLVKGAVARMDLARLGVSRVDLEAIAMDLLKEAQVEYAESNESERQLCSAESERERALRSVVGRLKIEERVLLGLGRHDEIRYTG